MTTEENKAAVRRLIDEVWNPGDVTRMGEFLTQDVYYRPRRNRLVGPEAYSQLIAGALVAFPSFRVTDVDMVADGDIVAVRHTIVGTSSGAVPGTPPSGAPVRGLGVDGDGLAMTCFDRFS